MSGTTNKQKVKVNNDATSYANAVPQAEWMSDEIQPIVRLNTNYQSDRLVALVEYNPKTPSGRCLDLVCRPVNDTHGRVPLDVRPPVHRSD